MTRIRVYVSGPYSHGGKVRNVKLACAAGIDLTRLGYAALVPHLNHYWTDLAPDLTYEDYMAVDLAWCGMADAVLRLPGHSPGADRECEHARSCGVPVFGSIAELVAAMPPRKGVA